MYLRTPYQRRRRMGTEERFQELTQRFLSDMAAVECSPQEYRDGLRDAESEIQVSISASLSDLLGEEG
jgi:hypothetical protein